METKNMNVNSQFNNDCTSRAPACKPPLVILTGPTAVGKTELSIALAKRINGEIISADSMQVYRGMDIGTAKITKDEMQGVPHHLIDIIEPDEEFNVVIFKKLAKEACGDIISRGKIPILTGGTGFYIQALLYDISFDPEINEEAACENKSDNDGKTASSKYIREKLEKIAETEEGKSILYKRLKECDPESAEIIHKNNIKRVIRALEFYETTGEKISSHNEAERQKEPYYNAAYFVLNTGRQALYDRIDKRVDKMLEAGLLDEVKALRKKGMTKDLISMQGLGYKEILAYMDGEISLEEAVRILKRDTRHFAKRQLTWFRRERDVIMLDKSEISVEESAKESETDILLKKILTELKARGIYNE